MSALHLPVTAFYAGILGLLMLTLAALVSGLRMKFRSSIRTDDTPELHEAVRRHGNFVEWVPFALLLLAIAELNGLDRAHLHVAGVILVAARTIHPFGVRHDVIPQPLRAVGSTLTFLTTLYLCAIVMWQALGA